MLCCCLVVTNHGLLSTGMKGSTQTEEMMGALGFNICNKEDRNDLLYVIFQKILHELFSSKNVWRGLKDRLTIVPSLS